MREYGLVCPEDQFDYLLGYVINPRLYHPSFEPGMKDNFFELRLFIHGAALQLFPYVDLYGEDPDVVGKNLGRHVLDCEDCREMYYSFVDRYCHHLRNDTCLDRFAQLGFPLVEANDNILEERVKAILLEIL